MDNYVLLMHIDVTLRFKLCKTLRILIFSNKRQLFKLLGKGMK